MDPRQCTQTAASAAEHPPTVPTSVDLVEAAVVQYLPDLERRAVRLTRDQDQARDLVQESVLRALRFKSTYRDPQNARAWLMRILFNLFVSQRRRRGVEREILERTPREPEHWSHHRVQPEPVLGRSLQGAWRRVPPKLAEVVHLVDVLDYSYHEAAVAQRVPVGTIMSRLHRGRARLAAEMARRPRRSSPSRRAPLLAA